MATLLTDRAPSDCRDFAPVDAPVVVPDRRRAPRGRLAAPAGTGSTPYAASTPRTVCCTRRSTSTYRVEGPDVLILRVPRGAAARGGTWPGAPQRGTTWRVPCMP